jgi:succinyl-CoA synthetase alpha subunit
MEQESIKNIIIIAEGIPESQTRKIIAYNKQKQKNIIGPSTVGAMVNGEFRVGNTG